MLRALFGSAILWLFCGFTMYAIFTGRTRSGAALFT